MIVFIFEVGLCLWFTCSLLFISEVGSFNSYLDCVGAALTGYFTGFDLSWRLKFGTWKNYFE